METAYNEYSYVPLSRVFSLRAQSAEKTGLKTKNTLNKSQQDISFISETFNVQCSIKSHTFCILKLHLVFGCMLYEKILIVYDSPKISIMLKSPIKKNKNIHLLLHHYRVYTTCCDAHKVS